MAEHTVLSCCASCEATDLWGKGRFCLCTQSLQRSRRKTKDLRIQKGSFLLLRDLRCYLKSQNKGATTLLKVLYYARFTLPMYSNNCMCLLPVDELATNEKSPSFFALFTFQKHTGVTKVTGSSTRLVTTTPPTVGIQSLRPARSRLVFVP